MNDNIVERLRECWCAPDFASRRLVDPACDHDGLRSEAADEIERLQHKCDRLLRDIQLVAQAPDSRFARDLLMYYRPLFEKGVGTSLTFVVVDEAVDDE